MLLLGTIRANWKIIRTCTTPQLFYNEPLLYAGIGNLNDGLKRCLTVSPGKKANKTNTLVLRLLLPVTNYFK